MSKDTAIFLAFLVIFSLVFFTAINQVEYIGIGDSAIYANIAQNLVEDGEYKLDFVMTYFTKYETITHFEDNWFPLPILTIAVSYLILGVSFASAKLTNYWMMILLFLVMYFVGQKVMEKKATILAMVILMSTLLLWFNIIVPMSEAAFALTFTATVLSLLLYSKTWEKKWLILLLPSVFLLGMARQSAIAFVPICFVWVGYLFRKTIFDGKFLKPLIVGVGIGLFILGGYFVGPMVTMDNYGYLSNQPSKNAIIRLSEVNNDNYEDVFSVHYDTTIEKVTTEENTIKIFGMAFLEYGRFLRDFLNQGLFSTIIVALFFCSLFSRKYWTRELAVLTLISLTIFSLILILFGHYEQRYFLLFAPVMCLTGSSFFLEKARELKSLEQKLAIGLFCLFLLITFAGTYSIAIKNDEIFTHETTQAKLDSFDWVKNNLPEEAALFSRHPATVGYHCERNTAMLPNEDLNKILEVAEHYGVNYFWVSNTDYSEQNPRFDWLYEGDVPSYFELVYDSHPNEGKGILERVRIYGFTSKNI